MVLCSDGSRFDGQLKNGQVWVRGNREKEIVSFDDTYMIYVTKKDKKTGTSTKVYRSSFRDWVLGGAVLKVDPN
jgi:hypothetical protein